MRIAVLIALPALIFAGSPATADAFLKREPMLLPPYVSVLVDTGTCGVGKVMKVRGAIPGRVRQRMCVPMGESQARNSNAIL